MSNPHRYCNRARHTPVFGAHRPCWPVTSARLYGSRVQGDIEADSDADVAVFLEGGRGERYKAVIDMAGIALDVKLETNLLVSPFPVWEREWPHAADYSNPRLLENVEREDLLP